MFEVPLGLSRSPVAGDNPNNPAKKTGNGPIADFLLNVHVPISDATNQESEGDKCPYHESNKCDQHNGISRWWLREREVHRRTLFNALIRWVHVAESRWPNAEVQMPTKSVPECFAALLESSQAITGKRQSDPPREDVGLPFRKLHCVVLPRRPVFHRHAHQRQHPNRRST